jgi:hypothetical protein
MKKTILALFLLASTLAGSYESNDCEAGSLSEFGIINTSDINIEKNVGNGLAYTYQVTEVLTDKITGVPLTYASSGNKSILLYKSEFAFNAKAGDKIILVWGNEEDEFQYIEKAVEVNDGIYIPESAVGLSSECLQ